MNPRPEYHPAVGMELAPGVVIAGRYRLDRPLGDGGMGAVWAATHTVTRRKLALKFLREHLVHRPDLRKRFLREARAASLVEHPNVVKIHDVFELDDQTPIMVMDLLEGETLGARLDRSGTLSLGELAELLLPVISAVGTAHELGIVHRDLKPDNIFITKTDQVQVLDFGIAKLQADEDATVTAVGAVLGTPCYMAPEQGFGEPDVDHRVDVWAIGVILYEALSGGRPVEGENLGQVLKRLMEDGIAPLAALCPDLPEDVLELVMKMLTRERADRLEDLREAFDVLERHARTEAPRFGAPGCRASTLEGEAVVAPISVERSEPNVDDTAVPHTVPSQRSKSRRALAGAGMAFVAVVAIAALWPRAKAEVVAPSAAPMTPSDLPAAKAPEPATATIETAAPLPEASASRAPARSPKHAPTAHPSTITSAPAPAPTPSEAPAPPPTRSARPGLVEKPPF